MNYLFIAPRFASKVGAYYSFPIGLDYVSASLKRSGRNVHCLNLSHYDEPQDELVARRIREHDIDVVLTGGLSPHYPMIKKLLQDVRKAKDVISIVGGGIVSSHPKVAVRGLGCDVGVVGEGEETVVDLATALENALPLEDIPGLAVRRGEEVVLTGQRSPIADLDSVAFPDLEGFEMGRYVDMQRPNDFYYYYPFDQPRESPLISSRSCPFKCTFCYHPLGDKYRKRSLDSIFVEVDQLIDRYRVNIVTFYDELFSASRTRMMDFCERIKPRKLKWQVQLRVDSVDREALATLKDSGCYYISYGIESANDSILKSMRKFTTRAKIDTALSLNRELGIGIQGNLIFGDPAETWETFQDSLSWWMEHRSYQINLSSIAAYPGSAVYHYALRTGRIEDELDFIEKGCPELNLTEMSQEQYKSMHKVIDEYCMKHFHWEGELLGIENTVDDPLKGVLYDFKARCPHCGSVSNYRNFSANCYYRMNSMAFLKIHCRHCNLKYDIPSQQRMIIDHLVKAYPGGRLALWGGGGHTKELLKSMPLSKDTVGRIFDNYAQPDATPLAGIPVLAPPDPLERIKETTDAILISSRYFEAEILRQIAPLKRHGVAVYRLYG